MRLGMIGFDSKGNYLNRKLLRGFGHGHSCIPLLLKPTEKGVIHGSKCDVLTVRAANG